MKIGLYFGSFNPIHVGHLIIANHLAEHSDLQQIWLVVTPHNPLKDKKSLLNDQQRLHLVRLAVENYPKLKASDVEFKLSQPNYTVNTLAYLQEKFPNNEFSIVMGEDNLKSFHKWKNFEIIKQNHEIYVYPRISGQVSENHIKIDGQIHIINAPIVEITSTAIREGIKSKKNVRPLLPEKVWEYMEHNNLYKK
jgi:nicotinate-nucleotide adenylyltransferase